jgi:hypothetical protein
MKISQSFQQWMVNLELYFEELEAWNTAGQRIRIEA